MYAPVACSHGEHKRDSKHAKGHVLQLLTEGLLVRAQLGELNKADIQGLVLCKARWSRG